MIRPSAVRVVFLGAALALAGGLWPSEAEAQVAMDGRTLFQQRGGRPTTASAGRRRSVSSSSRCRRCPLPTPGCTSGAVLGRWGATARAWQELSRGHRGQRRGGRRSLASRRRRRAALAESMALTDRIAYVVVEVPNALPGTTVTLNGRVLSNEEFSTLLAVDGNTAAVEGRGAGVVPYRGTSQVTAGHQARFVVRFGRRTPRCRPRSPSRW
ncbi:MAG: hypothetical protein IPN17_31580 [Deltaproteobacteria bacterium]|nr:hypothetical protein [Deltaproteobacteria bacterium]